VHFYSIYHEITFTATSVGKDHLNRTFFGGINHSVQFSPTSIKVTFYRILFYKTRCCAHETNIHAQTNFMLLVESESHHYNFWIWHSPTYFNRGQVVCAMPKKNTREFAHATNPENNIIITWNSNFLIKLPTCWNKEQTYMFKPQIIIWTIPSS